MPPQQRRDLRDGTAGGHHVIHQGDMPAGDRDGADERALQIAPARSGVQPLLLAVLRTRRKAAGR